MPIDRSAIEQRERETLAPYAALSSESKGRVHPQDEHPLRTAFQRDRDRIIHSTAFRRMEYKTQVFIPHEQDHFRTRLTHSIEVAQIGRTLARNLRLNEDLTEAVALVHDVGHTPFGHSGEEALNRLLSHLGGFNHNRQSLRVVDLLEQRYPQYPGLNLSFEVREGIAKHESSVRLSLPEFNADEQPTLEAALVDIADEIAYNSHDIDDGLSAGVISLDDIGESDFFAELAGHDSIRKAGLSEDYARYALVRRLVDRMTIDVLSETQARIRRLGIADLRAVRASRENICGYSPPMRELVASLKMFLKNHLYDHPRLVAMSRRAGDIISALFERLMADPGLMPPRFQGMLEGQQTQIVIADYIAGMTDRYAEKVYTRLSGRNPPPLP